MNEFHFSFRNLNMDEKKEKKSMELESNPQLGEQLAVEFQVQQIAALAAAMPTPSMYNIVSDIGELRGTLKGAREENAKLREKLKAFKKENAAMSQKIGKLESQNHQQKETIQTLEIAQEKVQKDLETVKKAKDKLRIEVEEKISKVSKENEILREKLEALTEEFDAVETENKELKRYLEQLRSDNTSLKEEVALIHQENEKLKDDMGELRKEHAEIRKKLDCKEIRLSLGQVAWILEAEIWRNVLPQVKMGKTGILFGMEKWLDKNKASKEGQAAQAKWDNLKKNIGWNDVDHRDALTILKKLRHGDAHPKDVDLEEARKQLEEGDYVGDVFKESCQEIIEMITKTRSLNEVKQ